MHQNWIEKVFQGKPIRSRIAPTPSGYLHVGNGLSFLYTWLLSRKLGGKLILRIDDLDKGRKRSEYVRDIFESLQWLGIDWDGGPQNPLQFEEKYSQHLRMEQYHNILQQLKKPESVYACSCSRRQWQQNSVDGKYPGTCRSSGLSFESENSPTAWRMAIPTHEGAASFTDLYKGKVSNILSDALGDFVIRKKNGDPAYQTASVADDLEMGVNLVVRGEDLLPSTAAQCLIANHLNTANDFSKIVWIHHPLLLDEKGRKLSKSSGAISLKSFREQGSSPAIFHRALAHWLGMGKGDYTLEEILSAFDPERHYPKSNIFWADLTSY